LTGVREFHGPRAVKQFPEAQWAAGNGRLELQRAAGQ